MLRTYWSKYRKPVKSDKIFLTELDEPMTVGVIRDRFRRYRRKAGLNEKVTMQDVYKRQIYKKKWRNTNEKNIR